MQNKLVSVCITTYNRKNHLPQTLHSVLKQTYENLEIILVDDFSNDGTQKLIEDDLIHIDKRIKYIRHKKNKGLAAARNSAILNSKGDYFTFCDDDDLWTPDFIKAFVEIALKYDDNWCFCCSSEHRNFFGTKIEATFDYEGILKDLIKKGYTPPVASQFYNLSGLKKINGYNENIKSGVDHDLWIRLAKLGFKIKYVPMVLNLPNTKFSQNQTRMTTSFNQRINGIKKSLSIWKSDLIQMYGDKFYINFCNAYLYREYSQFLIRYSKKLDIIKIIRIFQNISFFDFFKILIDFSFKILKNINQTIFAKNKIKLEPSLRIKK